MPIASSAPRTYRLFMALGGVGLCAAILAALTLGNYTMHLTQVFHALAGLLTEAQVPPAVQSIVCNVRLPRVLLALVAGAGLAAAGAAFQAIFSNPLATADTLGVSSGSAFGAVCAILWGWTAIGVQALSLATGLAAVAIVWAVSTVRGKSSMLMLILSGLVVAALFGALISLVKYVADPQDVLPSITYWLMGSMTGASMRSVALGAPWIIAGCVALYVLRWKLNALSLPQDEARALGIALVPLRAAVIIASTMAAAAVVSMCGLIGWVGLLVPHFVRLVVGHNNMRVIPASLLYGALFMVVCDTASRTLVHMEIPVSILTAIVGAPIFLVLLHRARLLR